MHIAGYRIIDAVVERHLDGADGGHAFWRHDIDIGAGRAGIDSLAGHHNGIGQGRQLDHHIHQLSRHQRRVDVREGGAQFDGAAGGIDHVADEVHRRGNILAAGIM